MPPERVPMRQAREIIRLKLSAGVATREIANGNAGRGAALIQVLDKRGA